MTFDIDANGILKVSAKDNASGKEQTITISGSTSLDKGEIDRMINEAESNAVKDKEHRIEAEARNEADSAVYQTEHQLIALGDKLQVQAAQRPMM